LADHLSVHSDHPGESFQPIHFMDFHAADARVGFQGSFAAGRNVETPDQKTNPHCLTLQFPFSSRPLSIDIQKDNAHGTTIAFP